MMGDNRASDRCRANETTGWIPNKEEFPGRDMQPPDSLVAVATARPG
ncbi:MAG: hypothetical protein JXA44_13235 [Methanospirillaceae archaeon]|nr:hypothetical protein [Methanospirillaceae archaeon]